jgi:phytoene/squalene synthetase
MCLKAFLVGHSVSPEQDERFIAGARALGAAFQKVNFLRDLSADADGLGRAYFPGVDIVNLTDEAKTILVADIDADLALSGVIVPELPRTSRRAVALAQSLFGELNRRIEKTPAAVLRTTRISVPSAVKSRLLVQALMGKVT